MNKSIAVKFKQSEKECPKKHLNRKLIFFFFVALGTHNSKDISSDISESFFKILSGNWILVAATEKFSSSLSLYS